MKWSRQAWLCFICMCYLYVFDDMVFVVGSGMCYLYVFDDGFCCCFGNSYMLSVCVW